MVKHINVKTLIKETDSEIQILKRISKISEVLTNDVGQNLKEHKFFYKLPTFLGKVSFKLAKLFAKSMFFFMDLTQTEYKKYSNRKEEADQIIETKTFKEKILPFLENKRSNTTISIKTMIELIVPLVENKQILIPLDSKLLAMIAFRVYKKQN